MKKCDCCGIMKTKTFKCKRCSRTVCLTCFDFDYWICMWCREVKHEQEYLGLGINKYETRFRTGPTCL